MSTRLRRYSLSQPTQQNCLLNSLQSNNSSLTQNSILYLLYTAVPASHFITQSPPYVTRPYKPADNPLDELPTRQIPQDLTELPEASWLLPHVERECSSLTRLRRYSLSQPTQQSCLLNSLQSNKSHHPSMFDSAVEPH